MFAMLEAYSQLCALREAKSRGYLEDMTYTRKGRLHMLDHLHPHQTRYQLCYLYYHHMMTIEDMASLLRDEANYIFNNNRLLVGWLERENQRTEAWLGKVLCWWCWRGH